MSPQHFDLGAEAVHASWKATVEQLHAERERADALARELQTLITTIVDEGAVRLGDGIAMHAAHVLATFKAARAK